LSSVVTVESSSTLSDSLSLAGSIGLISSRFLVNAPFLNNKCNIMLAYRHTYLDLLIKPVLNSFLSNTSSFFRDYKYYFHDFNGGLIFEPGKKDKLNLSVYLGKDNYNLFRQSVNLQNIMNWGNDVVSLSWMHVFNENSFINSTVSYSNYYFLLEGSQSEYRFELNSKTKSVGIKTEFKQFGTSNKIISGLEVFAHSFVPNDINAQTGMFLFDIKGINSQNAYESALFIEDEYSINSRFQVTVGLRLSAFNQVGPFIEEVKDEIGLISDTIFYKKGESLAFYKHLDPRATIKYQINKSSSVKLSYMNIAQYVHLATSSSVSLPSDIWLPSSKEIKPQIGNQVSAGYYHDILKGNLEFSGEIYYKDMKNQLEFIRGIINSTLQSTLYDNISIGKGTSYGLEFYLRKKSGKTTGWASYTLSRTTREFDEINEGKIYPAKYDRRHNISLAMIRKLNKKWSISSVFVYYSGESLTIPIGRYMIQGNLLNEYGKINEFKLPAYHRIDISITRKFFGKNGSFSELDLSIYNIYNRANIFYIFFEVKGGLDNHYLKVSAKPVSLFPIIPSISWKFKF
ncbi:MAG: TonB-dependent receptor plug domain-containing protein, partial [bacterium]